MSASEEGGIITRTKKDRGRSYRGRPSQRPSFFKTAADLKAERAAAAQRLAEPAIVGFRRLVADADLPPEEVHALLEKAARIPDDGLDKVVAIVGRSQSFSTLMALARKEPDQWLSCLTGVGGPTGSRHIDGQPF